MEVHSGSTRPSQDFNPGFLIPNTVFSWLKHRTRGTQAVKRFHGAQGHDGGRSH